MFLIYIFISTTSLTLPWTIAGFLHPFYTFSPAHRRVIRDTFIFNHSITFLPRALRPWVGIFLPTGVSYLMLLHRHFNLYLSRLPWEPAALPFNLVGLHTDPRNIDPVHLFVWFTVIHNLHVQNDSVLNSTMNCFWWKFNLSAPFLFRTLFACSKSCVKTIKKHFEQD